MSTNSIIEWTESTWNPLTGCTKISPGCTHCHAERMAKRLQAMGQPNYANGFQLTLNEHALSTPLTRQEYTFRIDHLRHSGACIKFLSLEPLLGPLPGLDLAGIDWVILGGESGPGARPLDPAWVSQVRDQCLAAGMPFFFKQWGGVRKKRAGRLLDGQTWDGMPSGSIRLQAKGNGDVSSPGDILPARRADA